MTAVSTLAMWLSDSKGTVVIDGLVGKLQLLLLFIISIILIFFFIYISSSLIVSLYNWPKKIYQKLRKKNK